MANDVPFNFKTLSNPQQLENSKFVELQDNLIFPAITAVNWEYRDSAPALSSVKVFPKYAILSYVVNQGGQAYTKCETRFSGNPSFTPSKVSIHNLNNADTNVILTLVSGLTCNIPISKHTDVNHVYSECLAVSAVNNYGGCSINFFA